jgi:hypothetical protein
MGRKSRIGRPAKDRSTWNRMIAPHSWRRDRATSSIGAKPTAGISVFVRWKRAKKTTASVSISTKKFLAARRAATRMGWLQLRQRPMAVPWRTTIPHQSRALRG